MSSRYLPVPLVEHERVAERPPVTRDPQGLMTLVEAGYSLIDFEYAARPKHLLNRWDQGWQKRVWKARVDELASFARNRMLVTAQSTLDWRIGRALRDEIAR